MHFKVSLCFMHLSPTQKTHTQIFIHEQLHNYQLNYVYSNAMLPWLQWDLIIHFRNSRLKLRLHEGS